MTDKEFAAGDIFFRPGEPGDRAYLIQTGQVEILQGADEPYTRVGLMMPGDVFGEMALIEERPRSLTARAVTEGNATSLTRDEFEMMLTLDPKHTRQYLRSLFERLRTLTARLGGEVDPVPLAPAPAPATPTTSAPVAEYIPAEVPSTKGPVDFPADFGAPSDWVVAIHPLTRKAAKTLPDEGLRISRFPLRIGRVADAKEKESFDLNDLWLIDDKPYNISRNHCEIAVNREGLIVRDRGSHLGCIVNDQLIGGKSVMGYARLEPGDNVVILGAAMSPYQFRVTVSPAG
jgi:hypothetical protein